MSQNPYDPRTLGVAAGSSSDILNLHLSDRAAKDFKGATKSIEETTKTGGFEDLKDMFKSMQEMLASPYIKLATDFFQTFQTFLDMGGAEAAGRLREALFSKENIWAMNKIATDWNTISNGMVDGILAMRTAYVDAFSAMADHQRYIESQMAISFNNLSLAAQSLWGWMDDLKNKFEDACDKIDDFIDKIKEMLGLD